jgi:hypothetical protein
MSSLPIFHIIISILFLAFYIHNFRKEEDITFYKLLAMIILSFIPIINIMFFVFMLFYFAEHGEGLVIIKRKSND